MNVSGIIINIVNDITNFCFRLLQEPYTVAPARPKTKFLMLLTIRMILSCEINKGEVEFLHKFMRAIGFSKLTDRTEQQKLITDIILNATHRAYTSNGEETILAEFCEDFARDM